MAELPAVDESLFNEALESKWEKFTELRDGVLKALEEARKEKLIGNSLSAEVQLYPDQETFDFLQGFGLTGSAVYRFGHVLHQPGAAVPEGALTFQGLSVKVAVAEGEKCERRWIVTPEVGHDAEHRLFANSLLECD